jgi:hypothetical protein
MEYVCEENNRDPLAHEAPGQGQAAAHP